MAGGLEDRREVSMKKTITVLSLVIGASLLLTALAVALAPDLLENPGGIAALFAAIFTAIMALGGGTITSWVETLFGEKKKKQDTEIIVENGGVYIAKADKVDLRSSPAGDPGEKTPKEIQEIPLSKEEAQAAYLSAMIDDFRPLSLAGMDMQSGDTNPRLKLEDIYISLNTTTSVEKTKNPKKGKKKIEAEELLTQLGREENRVLTALDALSQTPDRHMVLLGAPGTGKSTFVRYLSLRMARQLNNSSEKQLENWKGGPLLPVAISLGRFAESLPLDSKIGTADMLEKYIVSTLEADVRMKAFGAHVLRVLVEDGGLILFDGLDEVANFDFRPLVVQAVESFSEKYSRNSRSRFLVTCRVLSYQDARWKLAGWPVYELDLFSPEQIERFIEHWYDLHTALESGRSLEFAAKKTKLLAAVQTDDPRRLYEVARYPIILTMMAIVHAGNELPDSRAKVYEQCVELLLNKWQSRRSIKNVEQTRSLSDELGLPEKSIFEPLYEIAFMAHQGHTSRGKRVEDSGSLITEGLIVGVLQKYWQEAQRKIFLEYCQKANGLLMLRGTSTFAGSDKRINEYTFPHLSFEEFLASRHMTDLDPDEVRTLLNESHDRWRESVKFMGESYCFVYHNGRTEMNGLLEALSSPFPPDPTEKDWRALWLAGELLTYYKRRWEMRKSPYEDGIVASLRALVANSPLTPRERADAADILDQLSSLEDLYQFVPVSNFAISKYPVTNAQYERFLKPENFQNKRLWVDFPKYDENSKDMNETWGEESLGWLQKELQKKDNDTQDGVLLPRYWRDPRFGVNRRHAPVVGVSWYEASAYCNWLLQNWEDLEEGKQGMQKPNWIRLPLETEWAQAAGGEENERFAFGILKNPKEEITRHANTSESGIGRTTPVWMYPQGASPTGAMDMSGNVFEWQANFFDKDHDYLSLRGGSWGDDGGVALVLIRYDVPPDGWYNDFGFRVAVSLPNG